ncbi:MAG TPA: hypothetical protein DCL21_02565 [Alphaproteobacteria bacterium]|nr:hypothetical protein [Alphaproteobacteria bacterium]
MTDDKKMQDNSIDDTLSSIRDMVDGSNGEPSDSVLDLTETEMVSSSDKANEDLIDIKSFDMTGELNKTDEQSELMAKAQHGDDDAIAAFSKSLTGAEDKTEEPNTTSSQDDIDALLNATPAEDTTSSQDDVDSLLNNIGQVATETAEDLSAKATMLEEASKTYAGKDFSESSEHIEEDDQVEETPEAPQQDASLEDIAAAMNAQTAKDEPQETEEDMAQTQATEQLVKDLETKVTKKVALKAVPSVSGLQVGFPVEVLAEALRPMIADWVEENLPSIVEKLVKEELSKLADK